VHRRIEQDEPPLARDHHAAAAAWPERGGDVGDVRAADVTADELQDVAGEHVDEPDPVERRVPHRAFTVRRDGGVTARR